MTAAWIILGFAVVQTVACLLLIRRLRGVAAQNAWLAGRLAEANHNAECLAREKQAMVAFLNGRHGGIGYRVLETRETVDALMRHAAEVFEREPSLACWLEGNHRFLVELAERRDSDLDESQRRRLQHKSESLVKPREGWGSARVEE